MNAIIVVYFKASWNRFSLDKSEKRADTPNFLFGFR